MEIFSRFEIPVTTGKKRAAAPRFCISPDMSPTVTETVEIICRRLVPVTCRIKLAILSVMPDL